MSIVPTECLRTNDIAQTISNVLMVSEKCQCQCQCQKTLTDQMTLPGQCQMSSNRSQVQLTLPRQCQMSLHRGPASQMPSGLTFSGKCHLFLKAFGRLDPYGGTYDIAWEMSNVPSPFRGWTPMEGHLTLPGKCQMS